jgi:hypothetical protein
MTHKEHLLKTQFGFIATKEDEEKLIAEDRFTPVLVRCGNGRFRCAVQDLAHFVKVINASKEDYVRDASVTL